MKNFFLACCVALLCQATYAKITYEAIVNAQEYPPFSANVDGLQASSEKMYEKVSSDANERREIQERQSMKTSNRTGDFIINNGGRPQVEKGKTTWFASCKEGGGAFVFVQSSSPNIFVSGSTVPGTENKGEVGVGVEAALRRACKGR